VSAASLLLLAMSCVGAALLIGWLFSHPRTRPLIHGVGQVLRFLASIVR